MTLTACPTCGHAKQRIAPCPNCGTTPRRQLSTNDRGYGHTHRALKAALLPHAYGSACPICHHPMQPGQPLDLDHTTPRSQDPTSTGDRITHAHCNRSQGATRIGGADSRAPATT